MAVRLSIQHVPNPSGVPQVSGSPIVHPKIGAASKQRSSSFMVSHVIKMGGQPCVVSTASVGSAVVGSSVVGVAVVGSSVGPAVGRSVGSGVGSGQRFDS